MDDEMARNVGLVSWLVIASRRGVKEIPCGLWHDANGKPIVTEATMDLIITSGMYLLPCYCDRDGKNGAIGNIVKEKQDC